MKMLRILRYADSIGKNMAFIAFTDVCYNMEKPLSGDNLHFKDSVQL
jgi:hypothetical protein